MNEKSRRGRPRGTHARLVQNRRLLDLPPCSAIEIHTENTRAANSACRGRRSRYYLPGAVIHGSASRSTFPPVRMMPTRWFATATLPVITAA
jgi:hypothetical protein